MTATKPWYTSKGVWGGIATITAIVVNILFGEGTVTENELVDVVSTMAAAIGGAVALLGRIKARAEITR